MLHGRTQNHNPPLDPMTTPPTSIPPCHLCGHKWHGLRCLAAHAHGYTCGCPTSWKDPQ